MFDFLRQEGLKSSDRVLHLGRVSVAVTELWCAFLEEHHFVRIANESAVHGLGDETDPFDVAVADSLFPFRPFNTVARFIASVVRRLTPTGRFYATWFENPDPSNFYPIFRPGGITTFPDSEPYHYPFDLIGSVCDAVGATVERVPHPGHPLGESLLLFSRKR